MGRWVLALLCSTTVVVSTPAAAQTYALMFDIRSGPLAQALLDASRQAGIELVFDRSLVAGLSADPLRSRLTPEAAIQRLLQGTNLTLRRSSAGLYVVEAPQTPTLARQDATVAEVLVVGRRSQNADIRRLETDIQPYRVATGVQILTADRDNLDQYFGSRLTSNTTTLPPSRGMQGETRSEVDLRGLGANGTLVLIDGRRMPSIPAPLRGFRQPDLNAVPLHSIDRVETLTGAAGGIYGFGALGGAVNVVLDRDRDGVELHTSTGVTSRGDASQYSFEGRAGFTSEDGRTHLMLHAGGFRAKPLLADQRDYIVDDLRQSTANNPVGLYPFRPNGNSIFVYNASNPPLQFKQQFGGQTLSSRHTYIPLGLSGDPAELVRIMLANAGMFSSEASPGTEASDLSSTPSTGALIANARHRFDNGIEAYIDVVQLWNRGRLHGEAYTDAIGLSPQSPYNPFVQSVTVYYPRIGFKQDWNTRFDSARHSAGLVAPLPFGWRATADLAFGSADYRNRESQIGPQPNFFNNTAKSFFGNWAVFEDSLPATQTTLIRSQKIISRFRDQSLRLAGPVFETAAGVSTLTLLAERRVESVPAYTSTTIIQGVPSPQTVRPRRAATTSFYAELRSPLFDASAPIPIRGLEFQLALRSDTERDRFAANPQDSTASTLSVRFSDISYTAGAKISPTPWLMLRGSYATGNTPPPLDRLVEISDTASGLVDDPRRAKRSDFDVNNPFSFPPRFATKCCGYNDLDTVRVSTASLGGILTPLGDAGPRLTLDYSRIRKTRDVYVPTIADVLLHETTWPERVTRLPLTEADRARGYTGGVITAVDIRPANLSGLKIDTVDASLDWRFPIGDNRLRTYGDATYYIRQVQTAPFRDDLDLAGYYGRPIKWRANLGADWSFGRVTLGANVQYFGGYRINQSPGAQPADTVALITKVQGSERIPSQTYVDLHLAWQDRVQVLGEPRNLRVDFGVANVFDKAPPRESRYALLSLFATTTIAAPGYSRYGDPRQRRFVLSVSTDF